MIDELFDLLDDWRCLPSYQLERRVDIFFALYLPFILKEQLDFDCQLIIPEFPVRRGTINGEDIQSPNKSFKIDYLAVDKTGAKVLLVELKTDDSSTRESQHKYLQDAKEKNIHELVEGVIRIYKATSSKKKYMALLKKLASLGWIDIPTISNTSKDMQVDVLYIQPNQQAVDYKIISFDTISRLLVTLEDPIARRFAESLLEWRTNPNS